MIRTYTHKEKRVMQDRASEAVSTSRSAFTPFERSDGYIKLLSFVVSNARRGEIMAVDNYSEMVALMPDTESKIEAVHQANEECKRSEERREGKEARAARHPDQCAKDKANA